MLDERSLRDTGLFDPAVVSRIRHQLVDARDGHLRRMRLEWLLVLVLGTQLLHELFVRNFEVRPSWDPPLPPRVGSL
jgi:hypothetical protein